MILSHSFTVPVAVEQAWEVLLDIERIAPCMPGATIDAVDGGAFTGTVKVKLGPIGLSYNGKASWAERNTAEHRAVIDAQGRDSRGNGTARARITATLAPVDATTTRVDVVTELDITGKPAQFGRGVMVDVGNKLIGQFADCLAGKLISDAASSPSSPPPPPPPPEHAPPAGDTGARAHVDEAAPINLIESAVPAIAARLAPVLGCLVVLVLVFVLRRRRH